MLAPELRIAVASQALQGLMAQHGVRLRFSPVERGGRCIVDATRNLTGAYKLRGALASVSRAQAEGKTLVITASAGNHGAGVAHAAHLLGMRALVYVPQGAPQVKVDTIAGCGADVVKAGESFDEALAHARGALSRAGTEGAFVHPFDDLTVAAGQGTIGLEILERIEALAQQQTLERIRVFLPLGGGGLLAGVASTIKTFWNPLLPCPQIIGVVDESSPAALLGTLFGRPVAAVPDTIADGTKVAVIGETFLSVSHLVDYMMLVRHDEIVATMRKHEREAGERLEGAGALALTGERLASAYGLLGGSRGALSFALVSGRNIDSGTFERELALDARLDTATETRVALDVAIPERDGELLRFLQTVRHFNIASLTYKQHPGAAAGSLRAEFEVSREAIKRLVAAVEGCFPGSHQLGEGEEMVYRVGAPIAQHFEDELVTLDDRPGSFLRYIDRVQAEGALGSVGFLFYRKPAAAGRAAQVVLGHRR